MPSILRKIQKASFRGASFLVTSVSTEGGRKTVTHEFPNSDKRYVEDLGKLDRTFSIDGFITEPDYFTKRNALLLALEQSGPGILIHPFYGSVKVVAKPYTIVEDITKLGEARITMNFERAELNIFPKETGVSASSIASKVITAQSKITSSIAKFSATAYSNFKTAQDKLTAVGNKFRDAADKVSQVAAQVSEFNSTLNNFQDNLAAMVAAPSLMAANFQAAFLSLSKIANNPLQQIEVLKGMFGFGADDAVIPLTTATYIERAANSEIQNNAVNAYALTYAYQSATEVDYTDNGQVREMATVLEDQYQVILESNPDEDLLKALEDLRSDMQTYFNDLQVTTPNVITVSTNQVPVTVLTYSYYGDVTNTETVLELNTTTSPSFLEGDVQVLTQ